MSHPIIIIGGGASGAVFASQYSKMEKDTKVILLERSSYIGWSGCPMPYYLAGEVSQKAVIGPSVDYFKEKMGIEARLHQEVLSINSSEKTIEVRDREKNLNYSLSYSKLVLAVGAKAREFKAKGLESLKMGHFNLIHPTDIMEIEKYIEENKPKKAIVMGSGAISLEMAEAFIEKGIEVEMFTNVPTLFAGFYQRELLDPLYNKLEEKNIKVHYDVLLDEVKVDEEGRIQSVILNNKQEIKGNLLFTAIGVEPNLDLAKKADLKLTNRGLVQVSPFMETSQEDIYALGDLVATTNVITNQEFYLPLGDVADKQALILAGHLTGKKNKPFKGVAGTNITSFYEVKLGRTGLTEEGAIQMGFKPVIAEVRAVTKVSAFEGSSKSGGTMQLIYDETSSQILGASMVGYNAVAQFLDQVAIAINFKATLDDMFDVDYAYSPTNASVWNPFLVAYRKTLK